MPTVMKKYPYTEKGMKAAKAAAKKIGGRVSMAGHKKSMKKMGKKSMKKGNPGY